VICQFYLTLRCNVECEFCDVWSNPSYQKEEKYQEAPTEKILIVLENVRERGVEELHITGGEPLLYEKLGLFLEKAKKIGLKTSLSTNCLLYPDRAEEIKGLLDTLYFSLDYPFAEEHNRSRGRPLFNKVIKSIETATRLKENAVIFYTLTRDSVLYLPEMVEFCDKFNINCYLNPVYDFSGTQGFEKATLDSIRYFAKRKNVFIHPAVLEFIKNRGNNIARPRCRAAETVITVLPSGRFASPCFFNQAGREGKEDICVSCMRWPYMLPSFAVGFDRYRFLDWLYRRQKK